MSYFTDAFVARFWRKVAKHSSGCWLWYGARNGNGYGVCGAGGLKWLAHRVAWELSCGPIPEGGDYHGTCVLHRCDVPLCVNPDHLFLGTQADNMRDKAEKGRGRITHAEALQRRIEARAAPMVPPAASRRPKPRRRAKATPLRTTRGPL